MKLHGHLKNVQLIFMTILQTLFNQIKLLLTWSLKKYIIINPFPHNNHFTITKILSPQKLTTVKIQKNFSLNSPKKNNTLTPCMISGQKLTDCRSSKVHLWRCSLVGERMAFSRRTSRRGLKRGVVHFEGWNIADIPHIKVCKD